MAVHCAAAERGVLIKQKEKKESSSVKHKAFRHTPGGMGKRGHLPPLWKCSVFVQSSYSKRLSRRILPFVGFFAPRPSPGMHPWTPCVTFAPRPPPGIHPWTPCVTFAPDPHRGCIPGPPVWLSPPDPYRGCIPGPPCVTFAPRPLPEMHPSTPLRDFCPQTPTGDASLGSAVGLSSPDP